jgi:3-hydroxyisobutyrate dehydrogenase-like beta-hydroxyacid dehydrogenase
MVDFMATSERIGFIGVGSMGHGMAKNLVENGFPLTIMGHRNRAPVEDLIKRGAVEAKSPAEVAERSTIVCLCVTGSTEVEAIARGSSGLKAKVKPGSVVVDCSSSDPTSTTALAAELQAAGIAFADAPLSRTPKEAWEGTLDVMVGAEDAVFVLQRSLLSSFNFRAAS